MTSDLLSKAVRLMLRFSNEYPQSIIIQDHRLNLDIFVHTFYRLHSYKKEYKQLEQNIMQIRIFIGA